MDYPRRTFTTSRNLTYSYIYIPCIDVASDKQTILFLHGFPSLALDFYPQIDCLRQRGHPIIAPDLIGYGGSSRPSDVAAYKQKGVVHDLVEILDHHGVHSITGIAHDFGAQILTRMEFYFPARVEHLVFLTIGPITLGQQFDLDGVNAMTRKVLGYEGFGYQEFITRDPDASKLLARKNARFHDLMFTSNHDLWKDYFGRIGGLKKWLTMEESAAETIDGYCTELDHVHEKAFGADHGFEGPQNWYLGLVDNLNIEDDQQKLQALGVDQYQVKKGKKVLLITARRDVIASANMQEQMTRQCMEDAAADLTLATVDAGHWIGLEEAETVNSIIVQFLQVRVTRF